VFAAPGQAARGFLHLVQDRRNRAAARELPPRTVLNLAPNTDEVRRLFARVRAEGRLTLAQDEAMAVLAAYGVPTVPSRPAVGAAEAEAAARLLGFPVVVKRRRLDRPDPHAKGAVALDLRDADQVRGAAHMLAQNAEATAYLVQHQVGRARELLVRVGEDTVFGPTIGFGQGGTTAAFLRDVALDLPPLNLPLARALIARTRIAATLGALHDAAAANVDAVADTLVRVSQLVIDFPELAELEVNPLFVDADGVMVADAWLRLRAESEPPAALAINPYPAELSGTFDTGQEILTIRPIRPEDAEAHGELFRRLTPEDVRFRFFTALRELSPEQIARMTQVDYEREIAFIAVRESTGETVAVARLVRETYGTEGEFAVVTEPALRGHGVARHLMQKLVDWGRAQGMSEIVGQVLANNQPMLAFVRGLGFRIRRLPGENEVVEATLTLDGTKPGDGPKPADAAGSMNHQT
jgi:acetyltransferase